MSEGLTGSLFARWACACVLALGLAGCAGPSDETDLKPPPGFSPPPVRPITMGPLHVDRLGFGKGFYGIEKGQGASWRWMGKRGEVRLGAGGDGRAHRLRILGWIPRKLMQAAPTLQIKIGDHVLARFTPAGTIVEQNLIVGPGITGAATTITLVIETSSTVSVKGDGRELGLAIEALDWQTIN